MWEQNLEHLGRFLHFSQKVVRMTLKVAKHIFFRETISGYCQNSC